MNTKATSPDAAKEMLVTKFGFDEDEVHAAGDYINVAGDADAANPLGGVFYAVNEIGWRAFTVGEDDDGVPFVGAQKIRIDDAPGWRLHASGEKAVPR